MTGKDVAELYHFLETNPDLHTNGIRLWQRIKATPSKDLNKTDDSKVALAIGRFANIAPIRKHRVLGTWSLSSKDGTWTREWGLS